MIITTNLSLSTMKSTDLEHARIYDRILEICQPIGFTGKNYRITRAEKKKAIAKQLLQDYGISE